MDVFISWSGKRSGAAAEALKNWLPLVINAAKPFLSASDIDKGSRWSSEISQKLKASNFGIICLTPENLQSAWILFEAGALSKAVETARVCTFLIDLKPTDVEWPLGQFQHTTTDKGDILKLLVAVNSALGNEAIPGQQLEEAFELLWPRLESKLRDLPRNPAATPPERSDRELLEEILEFVRAQTRRYDEFVRAQTRRYDNAVPAEAFNFIFGIVTNLMAAAQRKDYSLNLLSSSRSSTRYEINTGAGRKATLSIPSDASVQETIEIVRKAVAEACGVQLETLPDFVPEE